MTPLEKEQIEVALVDELEAAYTRIKHLEHELAKRIVRIKMLEDAWRDILRQLEMEIGREAADR